MDYLKYIILIAGLALLIMSAVSLGSVNSYIKENDAKREDKKLNNIKNVSIVLLVIAILLVVMSGYEIFSSRKSAGFTYYF